MALDSPEMGEEKEGSSSMKNLPQKLKDPFPSGKPRVEQHMYLRVGDRVYHEKFKPWGGGIVIETWDSDLPGRACLVRILFQNGKKRVFDNSYDNTCCYYTGIILLTRIEL